MADSQSDAARLEYDGRLGELYAIWLRNLVLTLLTLGIYRFWAKTRMRRYLWSHMRFMGDRFEYTGTGGEKFRGFLLAVLLLIAIGLVNAAISYAARTTGQQWLSVLGLPVGVLYGALFGAAVYSAQRYRLSRTLWRGIRGGMGEGAMRYGLRTVWYGLLTALTLGIGWPLFRLRLLRRRVNASAFGDAALRVGGEARRVYRGFLLSLLLGFLLILAAAAVVGAVAGLLYVADPALFADAKQGGQATQIAAVAPIAVAIVLLVPLLGSANAWFDASVASELLNSLKLQELRFASDVTGPALFRLRFGNLLIMIGTFGIGAPIVTHRCARFLAARTQVLGNPDLAALTQNTMAAPRRGEGLLEALDVGISG